MQSTLHYSGFTWTLLAIIFLLWEGKSRKWSVSFSLVLCLQISFSNNAFRSDCCFVSDVSTNKGVAVLLLSVIFDTSNWPAVLVETARNDCTDMLCSRAFRIGHALRGFCVRAGFPFGVKHGHFKGYCRCVEWLSALLIAFLLHSVLSEKKKVVWVFGYHDQCRSLLMALGTDATSIYGRLQRWRWITVVLRTYLVRILTVKV